MRSELQRSEMQRSVLKWINKPVSKRLAVIVFVVAFFQHFLMVVYPTIIAQRWGRSVGEGMTTFFRIETSEVWDAFRHIVFWAVPLVEILTVPLTTLILCLFVLDRIKRFKHRKKVFVDGFVLTFFLGPVIIVLLWFVSDISNILDTLDAWVSVIGVISSIWVMPSIFLVAAFSEWIFGSYASLGMAWFIVSPVAIVLVSWPIWGGIIGMFGQFIFGNLLGLIKKEKI